MQNRLDLGGVALALLVSGAACAADAVPPPPVPMPAAPVLSYRFDGALGSARVARELAPGGFETVTGTLSIAPGQTRGEPVRSSERASLDDRGRLLRAEIAIEKANTVSVFTLEPSRGRVRIERTGAPARDWAVPRDAPWVYTPATLGDGAPSMTPISSWVALRAAAASAPVVRVLDPEHQTSYLAPIDQVAVPTERGTTVSFGYDAVDADEAFITELRLSGGALVLSLADRS